MADILGIVGGIAGNAINSILNNTMAGERTSQDRAENYRYGEMSANRADARTRALYNDFYSPQALMRQYKEAGLSPSLMFGGTPGQGGTSGAQGTGAAGMATPFMPMSMVEAAQAASLFAQADKTKAETKTIKGENERGQAEIQGLLAQNGLNEAAKNLTEAQKVGVEIDNYIKSATKDFEVGKVEEQFKQMQQLTTSAMYDALNKGLEFNFNQDTYDDRVKIVSQSYADLCAATMLKIAEKELNEEQVKYLRSQEKLIAQQVQESIARIQQEWKKLDLMNKDINQRKEIFEKSLDQLYSKQLQDWQIFQGQLDQDWKKFSEGLNWEKDKFDRQIKQGYWGMGTQTFNSVLKTAAAAMMMYYLKGAGAEGAAAGAAVTAPEGFQQYY